jgi:hypothetical protein
MPTTFGTAFIAGGADWVTAGTVATGTVAGGTVATAVGTVAVATAVVVPLAAVGVFDELGLTTAAMIRSATRTMPPMMPIFFQSRPCRGGGALGRDGGG